MAAFFKAERLALLLALLGLASSALPDRNCTVSLRLCAQSDETTTSGTGPDPCDSLVTGDIALSSLLSEKARAVGLSPGDCLKLELYPGSYSLALDASSLKFSLIVTAPQGGVELNCNSNDSADSVGRPLWLARDLSEPLLPQQQTEKLFVQMEGVEFRGCPESLQFDALDYVGISNCNFSDFTSSAVDILNCQQVDVQSSTFYNCKSNQSKDQFRGNAGALSIAYHSENTNYLSTSDNAIVNIRDCNFIKNEANFSLSNQEGINQAVNNQSYQGRGGGIGLFLNEVNVNVSVIIKQCSFDENYATFAGGGVYIQLNGDSSHHVFNMTDCNFTNNYVDQGRESFGGGLLVGLLIDNTDSQPSQFNITGVRFINNTADYGGGMSCVQAYPQGPGNKVFLQDSYFEGNSASIIGSATMFATMLFVQSRELSFHYELRGNTFYNNTSPGGVVGAGFIHLDFYETNTFLDNTGPGLRLVGSLASFNGVMNFTGNNAENYEGGALYIQAFGQVRLHDGSKVFFKDNIGRVGAAIVVDVQRSSVAFSKLIFNTQCFLIYEDTDRAPTDWENVTIHFSGNQARVGPLLYISHLDLCSWYSVVEVSNKSHLSESHFSARNFTNWPVFNYTSDNAALSETDSTSEDYYFQTEPQSLSCNNCSEDPIELYPGQAVELDLIGRDLFQNPTYFIGRITDKEGGLNSGAFSQSTDEQDPPSTDNIVIFEPALMPILPDGKNVEVQYQIPEKLINKKKTIITAVVDAPYTVKDIFPVGIQNITYTNCPPGYELTGHPGHQHQDDFVSCTCIQSTFDILACEESRNVLVLRDGLWASVQSTRDSQLVVHPCPTPYCRCTQENITCENLYYYNDPLHNNQCHPLRTGTLCGQCINGTGVGVLRLHCRDCSSNNYWALAFLVIGDVLVCVGILVALVKLHHTFPHSMKGFLFYIQTVYYATAYFPSSFWDARQYMLYLSSALGLYFPWDFCLHQEMRALTSVAIRFVPVTIVTAVAITYIIGVFYCFRKRAQRRIWHGLWAFVLLLYSPVLYNSLILLHCPHLPSAKGGDLAARWQLDGEVKCFHDGGHIALGLLAIVLVAILSLMIPVLFVFTVVGNSPRVQANILTERLYRALSAGYHERARWWGVWDLTRRLLLISVVVALPGRSVAGLYIVSFDLCLHLFFLPFKKWWQNLLEILVLTNYCLLLLFRSTQTLLDRLATYSGTMIPNTSGTELPKADRITAFFSFWLYLPLLLAAVTIVAFIIKRALIFIQKRRGADKYIPNSDDDDEVEFYTEYSAEEPAINRDNIPMTLVTLN